MRSSGADRELRAGCAEPSLHPPSMASSIINFVDSMDALLSGADSLFIVGSPKQLQVRRHNL